MSRFAVRQYRPAFFEGFENVTAEFDSGAELKGVPFVKQFAEMEGFHRFSVSDEHLMAEYQGGAEWCVIGTFTKGAPAFLPTWTAPPKQYP